MAGLVGYSSSDDDDSEGETQPQGFQTSIKTESGAGIESTDKQEALRRTTTEPPASLKEKPSATLAEKPDVEVAPSNGPQRPSQSNAGASAERPPPLEACQDAVLIGPSRPLPMAGGVDDDDNDDNDDNDDAGDSVDGGSADPPLSPYSAERAAVRQATLPRVADLDLPGSPRGTPPPSLEALGAKIDTFLALKRDKGVHFNTRLAQSDAMKNPALMDKLLAFVGMGENGDGVGEGEGEGEDNTGLAAQYATTLPPSLWDPAALPAWAHRKPLRALQDEMAKKRARAPGEKVAFVPASGGSGASPAPVLGKRRPR